MNLMLRMCNETNKVFFILQQHMKYRLSFKSKFKRKPLRHIFLSFSLLYLFIRSSKFVIIETCAYNIANDENAMISFKVNNRSSQKQPPVFYNKSCS